MLFIRRLVPQKVTICARIEHFFIFVPFVLSKGKGYCTIGKFTAYFRYDADYPFNRKGSLSAL